MTFIIFFVFGAIVGWLISQRKGTGYGPVADSAFGALGGLIGGWVIAEIGFAGIFGLLLSLIAAIVAALALIAIVRAVAPKTAAG